MPFIIADPNFIGVFRIEKNLVHYILLIGYEPRQYI